MKNIKKQFLLFACSLFIVSSIVFADDQIPAGKAALDRGDIQGAISLLREATQKDKKNPQAYLWLGTALLRGDSLDQANVALIQGRDLDTANAQFYSLLGDVYFKQRIYAAAVEQYKKASELDPRNIEILLKLAVAGRKGRLYNDVKDADVKILAIDSMNTTALRDLSDLFLRTKPRQYGKAYPLLERLSKLQPDSLNVQVQYVRVLSEMREQEKLIPLAERILQRDASQSEIDSILIVAYNATGKIDSAIAKYSRRNPDSLSTDDLVRLAKAYKGKGEFEKAIEMYQRAYRKDSTRCAIPYDLGTLMMKVKRYHDAVGMFEKKLACDTSSGYRFASHLNSAMSLMQLKEFKVAKEHVLKSIDIRSENIQAWQVLAQVCGQLEQTDEEIAAYKKVIELATAADTNDNSGKYNAQLQESYRMIGVRYLIDATNLQKEGNKREAEMKKKFIQAVENLKNALRFNPKDCEALLWTAQASQNSGNKEEAKKYYCKLLQQSPPCDKKTKDAAQSGLDALGMKCGE